MLNMTYVPRHLFRTQSINDCTGGIERVALVVLAAEILEDGGGEMGGADGVDAAGGVSWDAGGTIGVSDGCCCGGGDGGDGDTFGQMGGVDGGDAAGGVSWDADGPRAAPSEAIAALSSNALTTSEMTSHTGRFAETSSLTDSTELERTRIGLGIAGAWTMSLKSAS